MQKAVLKVDLFYSKYIIHIFYSKIEVEMSLTDEIKKYCNLFTFNHILLPSLVNNSVKVITIY